MTASLEFHSVTITNPSEAALMQQTRSLTGHSYQTLPTNEAQSRCCEVAKKWCSLLVYGFPYQPLSTRDVASNYCQAIGYLACAIGLIGISMDTCANPSKEMVDPDATILACALANSIALGAGILGIRKIYKTCKAPRLGDGQPLLPPSNEQNSS